MFKNKRFRLRIPTGCPRNLSIFASRETHSSRERRSWEPKNRQKWSSRAIFWMLFSGVDFGSFFYPFLSAQERAKSGQERAMSGQERPKRGQERPKSSQEQPKSGPRAARSDPKVPKSGPRAAKSAPRGPQQAPRSPRATEKPQTSGPTTQSKHRKEGIRATRARSIIYR